MQIDLHNVGGVRIVLFLRQLRECFGKCVIEGGERLLRLGVHVGRGTFPYRADIDAIDHREYPVLRVIAFHREIVGEAGFCLEEISVLCFRERDWPDQRRDTGRAQEEVFQVVHRYHRVQPSAAPSRIKAL